MKACLDTEAYSPTKFYGNSLKFEEITQPVICMYSQNLTTAKIFVDVGDERRKAVLIKETSLAGARKMAAITPNYFSSKMCKFHYFEFSFCPYYLLTKMPSLRVNLPKILFLRKSTSLWLSCQPKVKLRNAKKE